MKTEDQILDKLISFNLKNIKKYRKKGNTKKKMQHTLALEILYEGKRNLILNP